MMAQKAKLFHDDEIFNQILKVTHPNEAKQLGRKVQNYDEQVWLEKRFDIVVSDCCPEDEYVKYAQTQRIKLMY